MSKKDFCLRWLISVPILVVALVLVFSAGAFSASDKADVQIIENKAKPSGSQRLILTKEITIGKLVDEKGSMFGVIGGLGVAADGRVFVLDGREKKVKVFASNGEKLKEFGQEGQGPGEWNAPSGLQLLSDREIMITDVGSRKLVYFDLDGKLIKEVSFAKKLFMIKIIASDDSYLGTEIGYEGNSMTRTIAKYDANFNQLFKVDTLKMPVPGSGSKIDPFEVAYDYYLDSNGNIVYGRATAYEIRCFNPEGQLVKIVRKNHQPQTISQADKEEILREIPETPGINVKEMLTFPEKFPAFAALFRDEDDRLYVQTYEKGKSRDSYLVDIFSPEGKLITRSQMSGQAFLWKNGKLYKVEKDEEGYQYICRYQATWKK